MTIRIAINGYGRIGRNILRAVHEQNRTGEFEIVAVNDLCPAATNAHLTRHDSTHGPFPGSVSAIDEHTLRVNDTDIRIYAERDPTKLPWKELGVQVVHEATGLFTHADKARAHLEAGAGKVLISAPGTNVDATIVYGVNHTILKSSDLIVSNASCTTNCLAPLASVLHKGAGIEQALMLTVHAQTNDQMILDSAHSDLRRARSAGLSMIPTSTGAAKAVGLVLPELAGRLDGYAIRVPTPNVSIIDLTAHLARPTNAKEIDAMMREAADGALRGVLTVCDEPLVSTDFNHNPASTVYDSQLTRVMDGGRLVKITAWYDNEWGFANRMLDVTSAMANIN